MRLERDLKIVDCVYVAEFFLISMASRLTPPLFSSKKLQSGRSRFSLGKLLWKTK